MKVEEIRMLSNEELAKQLEDAYRELFNLRLRLNTHQLDNHRAVPEVRKKVARLKTIMRERELSGDNG
jgi:large subunit ribosomal protein L29